MASSQQDALFIDQHVSSPAEHHDDHDDNEVLLTSSRPIQRLEEAVVNRIAAGEIIHRPANALKELIENSLDAGSTMIRVTLKEGGLKMLQIQDNGHGIRSSDLPLLCERFATSKLRDFTDLAKMTTFGFRGEALASISFVSASMSVVTKAAQDSLAYKAFYASGAMVPAKPGQSAEPKATAGTDGTTIIAQDLFYNTPQRRRALKSASEEYNRALDVVGKYALHYGAKGVGFVCKKSGSNAADVSTPASTDTKTIDTIRLLHGTAVARELVHLGPIGNKTLGYTVEGWISGANWSAKRTTFLCFINNRLVDCSNLKRSFEALYSAMLPKGGHPWIYLSLELQPERLDVNVHPTKREVHFLDEDEIIEQICSDAQRALAGANNSRSFQFSQALLPGATQPGLDVAGPSKMREGQPSTSDTATQRPQPTQYPQHLVRVDAKTRTLEGMLQRDGSDADLISSDALADGSSDMDVDGEDWDPSRAGSRRFRVAESDSTLASIRHLREGLVEDKHVSFTEVLHNHTFVGVVDLDRSLSLLQHQTKLYLANHDALIEAAAYQLVLRQFGSIGKVVLQKPLQLKELIQLAIDLEAAEDEDIEQQAEMDTTAIVDKVTEHLLSQAEMMEEYFSLVLSPSTSEVIAVPSLLSDGTGKQEVFPMDNLPTLLLRLATQVDWTEEKVCFESIAREIAYAHTFSISLPPPLQAIVIQDGHDNQDGDHSDPALSHQQQRLQADWLIRHRWFPYFSSKQGGFFMTKGAATTQQDEGAGASVILQVANLKDLYRIFERC